MKTRNRFAFLLIVFVCCLLGWSLHSPAAGGEEGVDISGFANVGYLGYLAMGGVSPAGQIDATEADRIMLSEGDLVSVRMAKGHAARVGDLFTICRVHMINKGSVKGRGSGFVVTFLGRVLLKEELKPSVFRAQITDSFRPIKVKDFVLPYESVSPCVKPLAAKGDLRTEIMAVQDLREVVGQFSVVYLQTGYEGGVRRGHLLEIVRKKETKETVNAPVTETIMGYAFVIESRPSTATAVVLTSKEEFYPQRAYVKGIEWQKARDLLSTLPACRLE